MRRPLVRLIVCAVAAVAVVGCGASDDHPTAGSDPGGAPLDAPGELGEATVADPDGEQVTSEGGQIPPDLQTQGPSGFPSCPNMDVQVTARTAGRAADAAVCLVNKLRRRRGIRALKDNAQLRAAARRHAQDMVSRNYFSHTSKNGDALADRATASGYLRGYPRWRVGENLAWGAGPNSTAKRIVRAWMGSPAHKRNLLNRRFREAGLAVVPGAPVKGVKGPAGTYAHMFGARRR